MNLVYSINIAQNGVPLKVFISADLIACLYHSKVRTNIPIPGFAQVLVATFEDILMAEFIPNGADPQEKDWLKISLFNGNGQNTIVAYVDQESASIVALPVNISGFTVTDTLPILPLWTTPA
jgi:hypothetical protein